MIYSAIAGKLRHDFHMPVWSPSEVREDPFKWERMEEWAAFGYSSPVGLTGLTIEYANSDSGQLHAGKMIADVTTGLATREIDTV